MAVTSSVLLRGPARFDMVGIQGILTTRGWPSVDHGVCVDTGRSTLTEDTPHDR